jgi:protein gp37
MKNTKIQWADDTVNPVAGCDGCELWPSPGNIRQGLIKDLSASTGIPKATIAPIVDSVVATDITTEIWARRKEFAQQIASRLMALSRTPKHPLPEVTKGLESRMVCYAAKVTWVKGTCGHNRGFPELFERVTEFPGRMAQVAKHMDLAGRPHQDKPWLAGAPRMIFVSDLGDALSEAVAFDYLKREIVDVANSPAGSRHLWLWLTKRPARMAEFGRWLDRQGIPWPDNLVAMTSVTSRATVGRVDQLRKVPAKFRGLSVEPLWSTVAIDLAGVDWLIVGGESGPHARPFDLAWVRQLQADCAAAGTSLFVKQLGRRPVDGAVPLQLTDAHGGDWDEWPEDMKVREIPKGFLDHRPSPSSFGAPAIPLEKGERRIAATPSQLVRPDAAGVVAPVEAAEQL